MGPKLKVLPSANWLTLQKVGEFSFCREGRISKLSQEIGLDFSRRQKKRKLGHETIPEQRFKRGESSSSPPVSAPTRVAQKSTPPEPGLPTGMKNGESIDSLRRMILGELENQYTGHQKQYVSEHQTPQNLCRLILTAKTKKIRRPRLRNGWRGY